MLRADSRSSGAPAATPPRPRIAAFTLTEVLVAASILGIAVSMTMVVFVAAMKRAQHTELGLKGTAELRLATDIISQAVRSAPRPATVQDDGHQMLVPPREDAYLLVDDITWLDSGKTTKGTKSNQRNMKVTPATRSVVNSVWAGTSRPAEDVIAADVSKYFISSVPTALQVSDIVSVGDVLEIPDTSFGTATEVTVNSVSKNAGSATITFTAAVGRDVPAGTIIKVKTPRTVMFEVVHDKSASEGDLRYYTDARDLTKFTVLAHNIDPLPLSDPVDASSPRTRPFALATDEDNRVILNFQQLPPITSVGRTVQGVQTTVFTRNDPSMP
jgi:type II secretory pathway pseudopilin PulG